MAELRAETGWRSRQVSHSEPVGLALLLLGQNGKRSGKLWKRLGTNSEKCMTQSKGFLKYGYPGTPKSFILLGFPTMNHPAIGVPKSWWFS